MDHTREYISGYRLWRKTNKLLVGFFPLFLFHPFTYLSIHLSTHPLTHSSLQWTQIRGISCDGNGAGGPGETQII